MIRRCTMSIAAMAMMTIPVLCQVPITGITSYRGEGYTVWFPKEWKAVVTGSVLTLDTMTVPPYQFKIMASHETSKEVFFHNYRQVASSVVGFPVRLSTGTEPMLYGKWRGDTINGDGRLNGVEVVVSATAIEANGMFYLLQLMAPRRYSWQGHELLAALGRSLIFDRLPVQQGSGGGGATACGTGTQCLSIYNDAMNRITTQTVRGMR